MDADEAEFGWRGTVSGRKRKMSHANTPIG
jgi:hypothetical protein